MQLPVTAQVDEVWLNFKHKLLSYYVGRYAGKRSFPLSNNEILLSPIEKNILNQRRKVKNLFKIMILYKESR